jgi:hypothetical protein
MKLGNPALPISHGCCKSCVATLLAELDAPVSPDHLSDPVARERRIA